MRLLVKFVAAGQKCTIEDNKAYIHAIYDEVQKEALINKIMVSPQALQSCNDAIQDIHADGTLCILEFVGNEKERSSDWKIVFQFGTYNNISQLEVSIFSDGYTVSLESNYLEKLKTVIKNRIVRDWEKIIWLVDKDSEIISIKLYPCIYQTENLMREVINEVMTKKYGPSWWETYAPSDLKNKLNQRRGDYKSKVQSFNNVDERLMSIDIDDLSKITMLKKYRWVPEFNEKLNGYLNGLLDYSNDNVRKILNDQLVIESNLWTSLFANFLPEDFCQRFEVFAKDRNHVMHNKLLDRSAYRSIHTRSESIKNDLEAALTKINMWFVPEKSHDEELEEQQDWEMLEHQCKENDANVSIMNNKQIRELFEEQLSDICNKLEEDLRFRSDIEIEINRKAFKEDYGHIISVKSKIDESVISFSYDMFVEDEEGGTSELSISCSEEEDIRPLIYTNGAVELDDESGLYYATTQDEITDFNLVVDDIEEAINNFIRNYKEDVSSDDVAEYVYCSECGEDSICINEDLAPVGTCLNCGHVNELKRCDRCEAWFNPQEDGECIDEDGFEVCLCQQCLEERDAE